MEDLPLQERVLALNRFLEAAYGRPLKLSGLLQEAGMSESRVNLVKRQHLMGCLEEACASLVRYLAEVLPANHAHVLTRRYCLDGGKAATLAQVGEELGLSRERVRQLQEKGIARLRTPKRRAAIREAVLAATLSVLQAKSPEA